MQLWLKFLARLGLQPSPEPRLFPIELDVLRELEVLARHERRSPGELANRLLSQAIWERQSGETLARWRSLTRREQEVAALICLGYTNGQIARRLTLSPGTIKGYVHNVFEKFDLANRDELRALLVRWDFSEWEKM